MLFNPRSDFVQRFIFQESYSKSQVAQAHYFSWSTISIMPSSFSFIFITDTDFGSKCLIDWVSAFKYVLLKWELFTLISPSTPFLLISPRGAGFICKLFALFYMKAIVAVSPQLAGSTRYLFIVIIIVIERCFSYIAICLLLSLSVTVTNSIKIRVFIFCSLF